MKGTGHYIAQRVTAIGLIPVALWLIYFIAQLTHIESLREAHRLLMNPMNSISLLLFSIFAIYHGKIGIEIIIRDYVHNTCMRKLLLLCLFFVCIISLVVSIVTLIYLHVLTHSVFQLR